MKWFDRMFFALSERRLCHGIDVRILAPSPEEREPLFQKLCGAIELIAEQSPLRLRRLRRDLRGIWVNVAAGNVAEYHEGPGLCLLDRHHLSKNEMTRSRVAATLIHETTHARIARAGIKYEAARRARIETACFRAEIRFAAQLPDGAEIVDQARRQMGRDPAYWTAEAARERARVRLRDFGVPEWLIRLIVRAIPAD